MTAIGNYSPIASMSNLSALGRAFTLLEAWRHSCEQVGVSMLARRTGLPKSTCHRILRSLEAAGLVRGTGGVYTLDVRFRLLYRFQLNDCSRALRDIVHPFMQDLYAESHETVRLAMPIGEDVYSVERIHGHRPTPRPADIGRTLPAHSTALGKVILAYSSEPTRRPYLATELTAYTSTTITDPAQLAAELRSIQRHGVAFDKGETQPNVVCVAAPVLDRAQRAVAAISVSGPSRRFDPKAVVHLVRRTARAASLALASAGYEQSLACGAPTAHHDEATTRRLRLVMPPRPPQTPVRAHG